ncbi:phage regulatory protein/antirepressor Ant [Arthrobacter russicus]|uniref:Phage regulator Rha-like protein n=1 Tax=Arthrobacter russicus TaxID=172040 RepID=A0ABU1JEU4_9MICC|nr:phage regulatory protein/antirepressor Ant [Arthrobacter russicus]MDR6270655.1 phage regulator Rha-like protein [Arthrobacter russicus]
MSEVADQSSDLVSVVDGESVTTSLRIAEGVGNDHKPVIRLIRDNQGDLEEFGRVRFENAPFETPGGVQQREVALLNEQQATLLLTYMRNNDVVRLFKKRLVRAFFELAKLAQQPKPEPSFEQMTLTVLTGLKDKVEEQALELEVARPKAEAFDSFLSTIGDYSLNEAAKVISREESILIGEHRLRDRLMEWRWMFRDGRSKPRAMQSHVDCGRLVEKAQFHYHPSTGEKVLDAPQVRVTARGIAAIRERLLKEAMVSA